MSRLQNSVERVMPVVGGYSFLPALVLGVWLGWCSFKTADPVRFLQIVLWVLAVLALIAAVKAVLAHWRPNPIFFGGG